MSREESSHEKADYLEIEEEGTENIVADIIGMMRDKVDMNCEFRISQKILPEKFPRKKK